MDYSQIQDDEILVLESIYADAIRRLPPSTYNSSTSNNKSARGTTLVIKLEINLPDPLPSRFSCQNTQTGTSIPITTSTLPPLLVVVYLPPRYPGRVAPVVCGIRTWTAGAEAAVEAEAEAGACLHVVKEGTVEGKKKESEEEEEEECYLPPGTVRSITRKLRDLWVEGGGIEYTTTTTDEEEEDSAVGEGAGEGEGVLWSWLDWIGTGLFLDDVDSQEEASETERITKEAQGVYIIPTKTPQTLHSQLRSHLISTTTAHFNAQTFPCGICFDTKKGRKCVSLPCGLGCVFCLECLTECWSLAVREGAVEGVACPGWECVKGRVKAQQQQGEAVGGETRETVKVERGDGVEVADEVEVGGEEEIQMDLVREVVGTELADRYKWLKEKKRVENDPTYTMCPLQHCQSPVPPPPRTSSTRTPPTTIKSARIFRLHQHSHQQATPETDTAAQEAILAAEKRRQQAEEDLADRFRQCPTCQFSFCRFCNKTWHGTSPCPLPSTASFLTSYMATPENSPAREAYEKRYGKKQLTRMVAEWVEQRANAEWFEKHTRACAGCGTRVNKSAGCNHMICSKCAAHFCYRCGTKLRPADPYHHYRTPGSSCFEKLFDADEIARFEREVVGDPAMLQGGGGGFEDELAFGMGVQVDGWVGDVFPLQGNGGWW